MVTFLDAPAAGLGRRQVRCLPDTTPVREATRFLLESGVSAAPVIDAQWRLRGVFSLTDAARHQELIGDPLPAARGPLPEPGDELTVSEFMTPDLLCVRPAATVGQALGLMLATGYHRIFSISAEGGIDGVITTMDVLKRASQPEESPMDIDLAAPITSVMSRPVKRLQVSAPVRDAAEFMLKARISGAPVVDGRATPVGVFSLSDLARHVQSRILDLPPVDPVRERVHRTGEPVPVGRGFHFEAFEETKVGDLMTPGIISLPPQATVAEALGMMASTGLHRVFVMPDAQQIEGVVTSMDLLKWIRAGAEKAR